MVVLKQHARFAGQRVVPAAGIPPPTHSRVVQPIADRGEIAGPAGIDIVDRPEELVIGGARIGRLRGVGRINRVSAVHRQVAVVSVFVAASKCETNCLDDLGSG